MPLPLSDEIIGASSLTSRQIRLGRGLARGAFGVELLLAGTILIDRGPDTAALVAAVVLVACGIQAYGIFGWPFWRMLLEVLTRGTVLLSGIVVSIFWTRDEGHEVLQQWLGVFAAGGAGLLGLAILRYLDDDLRGQTIRAAEVALWEDTIRRMPQSTPTPHRDRYRCVLLAVLVGAWLGRRRP